MRGRRFELDFHNNQYMIFIIHDPEKTGLSNGFRALEGQKPIKLPEDSRIIDSTCRLSSDPQVIQEGALRLSSDLVSIDPGAKDGQNSAIRDTSCFSIVFSPTGKLAIHPVRVRNRDGIYKPDNSLSAKVSIDDIFNSPANILNFNIGMFMQDDDWPGYSGTNGSLGAEMSRDKFYIYEKSVFNKLGNSQAKSDYIARLEPVFINQYTGTIVKSN